MVSTVEKGGRKSLVTWSYGVGEEGIRQSSNNGETGVVIDGQFPWWCNAVKAMGINVLSIWLRSEDPFSLSYIKPIVGPTPIFVGPQLNEIVKSHLMECEWVMIGGGIPESLFTTGILRSSRLKVVLFTAGLKVRTPIGWYLSYHKFKHSDVGGVTDGDHGIYLLSREEVLNSLLPNETPRQDLRSILKSGENGVLDFNVFKPIGESAATSVRYCGPCVIEESSLYPMHNEGVMVRTQWRGYRWVRRKLSLFERLLSMDVPEKLIRMIPEGVERKQLLNTSQIPAKVLYACLESLLMEGSRQPRGRKRLYAPGIEDQNTVKVNKRRKHEVSEKVVVLNVVGIKRDRWTARLSPISEVEERVDTVGCDGNGDQEALVGSYNDKATKNDGAEVRTSLWDYYLLQGLGEKVEADKTLKYVRWFGIRMLMKWKRRLTASFFQWARTHNIAHCDRRLEIYDDAKDCIIRAADSTSWAWDKGSRPFFWRWPIDYLDIARNGSCVWFDGQVKPWTQRQRGVTDPNRQTLIESKLDTIRAKGYVETGTITSLMPFFDVPKGTDDIRMVYDGSASGLNGYLWAPWFSLPTYSCLLRALEPGYSMADNDVGEMFHNFMLHPSLRRYCGLDMTLYSPSEHKPKGRKKVWMRWNRLAMGLRPSPYSAVQGMMIAQEVILGDQFNDSNIFRWNNARVNLPGSIDYDPSKSWYTKVRLDGMVAADVFIYVDDIRCSAPTQLEAWQASQRISSVLGFLGLQDAARKRRDPGQETGAWTGSVVWTSGGQISVMTTQEKWDKVQAHLLWIKDNVENAEGLDMKRLQSIRGFLVYVSRTYGSLVPYLKGLHSTIDSWRFGRTATGWKIGSKKLKLEMEHMKGEQSDWDDRFGLTPLSELEPTHVMPVPRFRDDLKCLMELTSAESPPHQMGRMKTQARVMYGFGDASKHGFGASIELPDKSLYWRFGQWRLESEPCQDQPELGLSFIREHSSNYRELRNLVEALESSFTQGMLLNREIFMFTDNSTAEAAFFKGTSSSELLFELVLRLRKIEMTGQCFIHMIHVAGTRMINQGTDGLSRGDKTAGVMAGETMLSFVPLHLTAFERSPQLLEWIIDICQGEDQDRRACRLLTPSDWPTTLLERDHYVWTPPPTIADVAGEYMAQSIHKRSHSTHIFICPRLMTSRWTRIVRKATDMCFTVPIGTSLWSADQHEPLMIHISFPLSRDRPWKHGGTQYCEHIGKVLPSLLHSDLPRASVMLRECFIRAWGMAQV